MTKRVEQLSDVVVRFAGDSGDGMLITGAQFTLEAVLLAADPICWLPATE